MIIIATIDPINIYSKSISPQVYSCPSQEKSLMFPNLKLKISTKISWQLARVLTSREDKINWTQPKETFRLNILSIDRRCSHFSSRPLPATLYLLQHKDWVRCSSYKTKIRLHQIRTILVQMVMTQVLLHLQRLP